MALRTSSKTTVYLVGATGRTGSSIADALLQRADQFEVIAAIRPSSANKPEIASLRSRGAGVHIIDIAASSHEQIVAELKNAQVDVFISTLVPIAPSDIELQKTLAKVAKEAGVKRFVPSDWATACPPGVMRLRDTKIDMHNYIKELGLNYTFIDVGWWADLLATFVNPSKTDNARVAAKLNTFYGDGNVKTAYTYRPDIGEIVARIIVDDRTLNRYVFIWGGEVSLDDVRTLGESILGKKLEHPSVSKEELEAIYKNPEDPSLILHQYMYSCWVRGDNTVANAKRPEYGNALDSRELYPDYKMRSLKSLMEEFAAEFKAKPE